MIALPLGATPIEVGTALVVTAAVACRGSGVAAFHAPALALALGWLAYAGDAAFDPAATLRRVWVLAPALAVPIAWDAAGRPPAVVRAGLAAAALSAAFALGQGPGAAGLFSHHLSLGYALVPPLVVAVWRRDWLAVPIGAGIVATLAFGPILAAATAVAAVLGRRPAAAALATALGTSIGLLGMPWFADEVRSRAILWTGGAALALRGGVPEGAWRAEVAPVHRTWAPGFEFPHHAHDNLIQLAGDAGPVAWVAAAVAVALAVEAGDIVVLAILAGAVVGGLTQDLVGDMEVVRAAIVWAAIAGARRAPDPADRTRAT